MTIYVGIASGSVVVYALRSVLLMFATVQAARTTYAFVFVRAKGWMYADFDFKFCKKRIMKFGFMKCRYC